MREAATKLQDAVSALVEESQEAAKEDFERTEREFRQRSDEAAGDMEQNRRVFRTVQKLSADALVSLESTAESRRSELQERAASSERAMGEHASEAKAQENKLRKELDDARKEEYELFESGRPHSVFIFIICFI